jgi:hypothetical protein
VANGAQTPWTSKKEQQFLDALAETANVSHACTQCNVSRASAYWRREQDKEFAEKWRHAMDVATDALEAEARRRAFAGVQEPVFYQGVEVSRVRKYSDTLLIFLLKGARPNTYRDRWEHSGPDGGPIVLEKRVYVVDDGKSKESK